jgi:hypothetical protein
LVRYAIYTRTKDGVIERVSYAVSIYRKGSETCYIHKELIAGFPEPAVFWASNTGASVGIAPMESPSISSDPKADQIPEPKDKKPTG